MVKNSSMRELCNFHTLCSWHLIPISVEGLHSHNCMQKELKPPYSYIIGIYNSCKERKVICFLWSAIMLHCTLWAILIRENFTNWLRFNASICMKFLSVISVFSLILHLPRPKPILAGVLCIGHSCKICYIEYPSLSSWNKFICVVAIM